MSNYPLAILKFTWSDAPWQGDKPAGLAYDDALIDRIFLPWEREWGVGGYWREATLEEMVLQYSEVFPWRKLSNLPAPTAAMTYPRGQVAAAAVAQAQAEEWPLQRFRGIVVLVAPRSPFADTGATGVGQWPACLLQLGDSQYFCAHEMGHVLGFEHTLGPDTSQSPSVLGSYRDPYCVMGDGWYAAPPVLPPAGPPAGDGYWSAMAPLASAASLCAFLPAFLLAGDFAKHVGPLTPEFRRTLRLRARDLPQGGAGTDPVVIVADVPGAPPPGYALPGGTGLGQGPPAAPVAWVIELRRGAGWDRGIGLPGAPAAGLVVHTLRPIDEFPTDAIPDFRPRAVYEGVFPLDPTSVVSVPWGSAPARDADRRFGDGVLTLQVEDFAPDLSWAEVTVGGALLGREGAVLADIGRPDGVTSETLEQGVARGLPIFICGSGDHAYTLARRSLRYRSIATAFGYDQPVFTWSVNGVVVDPLAPATQFQLSVPVTSHVPSPSGGETVMPRLGTLDYLLEGSSSLVLIAHPVDGNHVLDIAVSVREGNPARTDPAPPSTAFGAVHVTSIVVTYDQAYYDALKACVARVKDIDHRFSKSRRPGPPRPFSLDDRPERQVRSLQRMQEDLEVAGHAELAEQVGAVVVALRSRPASMQEGRTD